MRGEVTAAGRVRIGGFKSTVLGRADEVTE